MFRIQGLKNKSANYYAVLTLVVYVVLWWMNSWVFQAFCVPVTWARIVLILGATSFVMHFYNWSRPIQIFIWFSNGLFIWVCFYCVWFILDFDYWLLSFIYLFLPILAPMALIFILKFDFNKNDNIQVRRSFYVGLIVPFLILLINAFQYINACKHIRSKQMQHSYWEEKIVGMHFRYHTRMCLFDGWRPPMHDPMLVVFNRIVGDPLEKYSLSQRIKFYKKEFPHEPIRVECSCSEIPDAKTYLTDPVFE